MVSSPWFKAGGAPLLNAGGAPVYDDHCCCGGICRCVDGSTPHCADGSVPNGDCVCADASTPHCTDGSVPATCSPCQTGTTHAKYRVVLGNWFTGGGAFCNCTDLNNATLDLPFFAPCSWQLTGFGTGPLCFTSCGLTITNLGATSDVIFGLGIGPGGPGPTWKSNFPNPLDCLSFVLAFDAGSSTSPVTCIPLLSTLFPLPSITLTGI